MGIRNTTWMAAVLLLLSGCAALLAPNVTTDRVALRSGAYVMDPQHAALLFKVDHLGLSTFVGRFERFEAALDFDAENPEDARIEVIVDMTSLDVADDDFAATLQGGRWFDAASHPQAVFRSTRVESASDNTLRLIGDLTLKGTTREIALDVAFRGGANNLLTQAYTIGFDASGEISRSAFGVDAYAALLGDAVAIEIFAEFQRQ